MPKNLNANLIEDGMCLADGNKANRIRDLPCSWFKATIHYSPVRVKTAEAYGQVG